MNWKTRRVKDKLAQSIYFYDHPYCEVCLAEGRGRCPADDVHEILYRSQGGKCVPENEISMCRPDHDRAHFKKKPYLRKEDLLRIKAKIEKEKGEEIIFGRVKASKEILVELNKKVEKKREFLDRIN